MKQLYRLLCQGIVIGLIVLLLFEMAYRHSIIDFYKPELKIHNTASEIDATNIDYLVFGDSFSAWGNNYVNVLKESHTEKSFINSGISGIGLKELNTFASRRIKRYKPKHIIYQVYIGNDLVDVKHLSNWKSLPLSRNIYWKVTDYLTSGVYINKRLSGFKQDIKTVSFNIDMPFSVEAYSQREKMMIRANNSYLEKSIRLNFKSRYQIWKDKLETFLKKVPEHTKVHIIFIPHCSQLNGFYLDNMLQLGAVYKDLNTIHNTNYNFFTTAKREFQAYKNVIFLNPLEEFKRMDAKAHRVYYETDPHLTTFGQKVLAEYLTTSIFKE